jgi:putative phosphoesterase
MADPQTKRNDVVTAENNGESNAVKTFFRPNATMIGILADTHILDRNNTLHPKILESFSKVDLILHAGDITTPGVIKTLNGIAETIAVRGNNRGDRILFDPPLPGKIIVQAAEGYRIGLCHGAQNWYQRIPDALIGRLGFESLCTRRLINRVRTIFTGVNIVVYGHGHWPMLALEERTLFINPGKAFGKKSASCALMEIRENVRVKIIPISPFKNPLPFNPDWNEFQIVK